MHVRALERRTTTSVLLGLLLVASTGACQRQPSPAGSHEDTAAATLHEASTDPGAFDAALPDDVAPETVPDSDAPEADDARPAEADGAPHPEGVFTGVMPCEACPGLETTLYLHADGAYELVEREGTQATVSRRQGVWYASADGHAILIADDENGAGHHIFEWYGEDALRLLPDEPDADWDDTFLLVRAD